MALLRDHRRQGTNGDAQSEVRGLPDHYPQSISRRADFGPLGLGVDQRGVARGPVSAAERRSPHRRVALFAVPGCSGHRSANGPGVVVGGITPLSTTADQWDPSLVAMPELCLMPWRSIRSRAKRPVAVRHATCGAKRTSAALLS